MPTTTENGVIRPKPKVDLTRIPPLESAADFLERDIPPLKHIVRGLGITEGVGLVGAREKVGKTWWCYQLGYCVASGEPFLGYRTTKGSVLYFDYETSEPVRKERLRIMFPNEVPENLYFINSLPDWTIGEGFEEILSHYLEQVKDPKLVIIDVLDLAADEKKRTETDKKHAYRNISALKPIAEEKHIAILGVTHFRKQRDEEDFLSNFSGTNGWVAAADYAIGIERKRGEADAALKTNGRTAKSIEIGITQDSDSMMWKPQGTLEEVIERKQIAGFKANDITKAVIEAVKAGNGRWEGTSEILKAEVMFDQDKRLLETPSAITRYIRRTSELYRKVYNMTVIDRNEGNTKGAYWVISKCI